MPIKQLMFIKYIFERGQDLVDSSNSMRCALAISNFHDSVELLIWTIAKEVDANINERDGFLKIFDAIPEGKRNSGKKQLPLKAKMIELNKARVNVKHYGNLPAPSEALKFLGYTEEFLREAITIFFNTNFDGISLVDLIENEDIRVRLKESEALLTKGKLENALCKAAEAEYIIGDKFNTLFPKVERSFENAAYVFEARNVNDIRRLFKYIAEYLNALRNIAMINLLGIKMPEHIKYRNIAPSASRAINGKFYMALKPRKTKKEEVDYCIKYVTQVALYAQDKFKSV